MPLPTAATEDEKIRADYAASVSLLAETERDKLWQDAKAYCRDWLAGKIPATPKNSAKLKKQIDIFTADCDPDAAAKLLDSITNAMAKSNAGARMKRKAKPQALAGNQVQYGASFAK